MSGKLTVSGLARRVGLTPETVRYYERVGVLAAPPRSAAGYRLYDEAAAGRLRLVRCAQRCGLRLREIRELLEIIDRGQCPCGHTEALLTRRLAEVDAELERLRTLRGVLARTLAQSPTPCPTDTPDPGDGWWCVEACSAEGGDTDRVPAVLLQASGSVSDQDR
jgi:DNA-binding transcriptional MerR regulator